MELSAAIPPLGRIAGSDGLLVKPRPGCCGVTAFCRKNLMNHVDVVSPYLDSLLEAARHQSGNNTGP